jgi:thiamine transport system substrate-binding protein
MRVIRTLLWIVLSLCISNMAHAELPTLKIYTVKSFTATWAAGPVIKRNFETMCKCHVEYISFDNTAGLLSRLKLEGDQVNADLVLGFDANIMEQLRAMGQVVPHHVTTGKLDLPIAWNDPIFLPYEYGYFAFLYDQNKLKNPPVSFAELLERDISIIIADPRSCATGMGLLLWVKAIYGDQSPEIWRTLAKHIVTTVKSWGDGYALFLRGEADMILSYTTSPAYHIIAENDHRYHAANFAEGHYLKIDLMAMLKHGEQPELARRFMQFALTPEFQKTLPIYNFMYPVAIADKDMPGPYHLLTKPKNTFYLPAMEVAEKRPLYLQEWLTAFH